MFVTLSHTLAFAVLFLAAIFDLKTTEVPDSVSIVGVLGGIILHFMASLSAGFDINTLLNFSLILHNPVSWIQALGDPLLWSLGVGLAFSIYGWGIYFLGMWGGADAFAMSVLGFAAPYSLTGFGLIHSVDLFLNIMIAGFLYTIVFAFYQASKQPEVWKDTWDQIKKQEKRVSAEIVGAGLIGFIGEYTGSFNGLFYFGFFLLLIFLYRFLKNIQDNLLSKEIPVSELEGGEVLAAEEEEGGMIVGITEEEIQELDQDTVEIREGIRFIPVFPIALLMTDVLGVGILFFQLLVS
jgi:Flp pilus assembly protein protease CpaA